MAYVGTRKNSQRERRLLAEYLAMNRGPNTKIVNFRLGKQAYITSQPLGPNVPQGLYTSTRMWVDAIVVQSDHIELWEASIIGTGQKLGQLLEYQEAWNESPESQQYANMPTRLYLLCAACRPTTMNLAPKLNIQVEIFTPYWLSDEFTKWYGRLSRPILPASASITGS